jgi:hypothetical protein
MTDSITKQDIKFVFFLAIEQCWTPLEEVFYAE